MADTTDDHVRKVLNAAWMKGGCKGVEDFHRRIRTCSECGHEHDEELYFECHICGAHWLERLKRTDP